MAAFIVAATALTLAAVAAILFGARPRHAQASRAAANAAVLRQQLAELEAERGRGALDEIAFARAREELQRRLIAEDDAEPPAAGDGPHASRRALYGVALLLPLAAAGLYLHFGQPQLLGLTSTQVPAASLAAEGDDRMLARLEAHAAAAPADARAWVLLARARMQRDEFAAAAAAYARALQASTKVARDPLVWCEYADALGMAQGGRLAGRPRELIDKALALDAGHPRALEMAGSAAYEVADFRGAARYWRQLLVQVPADSVEHTQLAAAVERAEQKAGVAPPGS